MQVDKRFQELTKQSHTLRNNEDTGALPAALQKVVQFIKSITQASETAQSQVAEEQSLQQFTFEEIKELQLDPQFNQEIAGIENATSDVPEDIETQEDLFVEEQVEISEILEEEEEKEEFQETEIFIERENAGAPDNEGMEDSHTYVQNTTQSGSETLAMQVADQDSAIKQTNEHYGKTYP